jgi:hypothetical protein
MPTQAAVGWFLATFKDYPARQRPASITIQQTLDKISHPTPNDLRTGMDIASKLNVCASFERGESHEH